jgi:hypothetical protein
MQQNIRVFKPEMNASHPIDQEASYDKAMDYYLIAGQDDPTVVLDWMIHHSGVLMVCIGEEDYTECCLTFIEGFNPCAYCKKYPCRLDQYRRFIEILGETFEEDLDRGNGVSNKMMRKYIYAAMASKLKQRLAEDKKDNKAKAFAGRIELPECIVNYIRLTYPNDGDEAYVGFKAGGKATITKDEVAKLPAIQDRFKTPVKAKAFIKKTPSTMASTMTDSDTDVEFDKKTAAIKVKPEPK